MRLFSDFSKKIMSFVKNDVYNPKWTCNICGEDVFNGEYFCDKCKSKLPYNDGSICNHCGRKTVQAEEYCLTCKNRLTSIDLGRSAFNYGEPISGLIRNLKYDKRKYLAEILATELVNVYFKNFLSADFVTYIPMTKEAEKMREYNHAKLIAEYFSSKVELPLCDVLIKTKETDRQARLSREERLKNLKGAFKVVSKKSVKDKRIIIVDDVTTTGATAEVVSSVLKKAGAKSVILLTVASVSDKQ